MAVSAVRSSKHSVKKPTPPKAKSPYGTPPKVKSSVRRKKG